MSANKRAPPPRKPWLLDNTSSSSLRGMEIGLPPGQRAPPTYPAPTPGRGKPLPPLPTGESGPAYRHHAEMPGGRGRPLPPLPSSEPGPAYRHHAEMPGDRSELPHTKYQTVVPRESRNVLTHHFGTVPPPPTGHNSRDKIKQLMGVDIYPQNRGPSASSVAQEVSPLSPGNDGGSMYSQDLVSPEAEIQEADARRDLGTEEQERNAEKHRSTWKPWRHPSVSPVPIPAHLNIVKESSRSTAENRASRPHDSSRRHGSGHANDRYHAIALDLARVGPPPSPQTTPTGPSSTHARVAPPADLDELDRLRADTYKPPIRTAYPCACPCSCPRPDTPHPHTGRWLSRLATTTTRLDERGRRPSLVDRLLGRDPRPAPAPSEEESWVGVDRSSAQTTASVWAARTEEQVWGAAGLRNRGSGAGRGGGGFEY